MLSGRSTGCPGIQRTRPESSKVRSTSGFPRDYLFTAPIPATRSLRGSGTGRHPGSALPANAREFCISGREIWMCSSSPSINPRSISHRPQCTTITRSASGSNTCSPRVRHRHRPRPGSGMFMVVRRCCCLSGSSTRSGMFRSRLCA